jgi:hypothetical protein
MKTQLLLIALLMSSVIGIAQTNNYENSRRKTFAKNKVKTYTVTKHMYLGGKPRPTGMKIQGFIVDRNGRDIEQKDFNERGTLAQWFKTKYNEKGHPTAQVIYKPDGSILGTLDARYEFDSAGNMIKLIYSHTVKGDILHFQYGYDEHGWTVEDRFYDPTYLQDKNRYIYDSNGRLTKIEHYGSDPDRVKNEEEYIYNEKAQLKEVKFIGYNQMVSGVQVYKYLPNGLISEIISYDEYNNAQFTLKMAYTLYQ